MQRISSIIKRTYKTIFELRNKITIPQQDSEDIFKLDEIKLLLIKLATPCNILQRL